MLEVALQLNFARGGSAECHLGQGWSAGEAESRWMVGEVSEIWLNRPREPGEYVLELDLHPFVREPEVPGQTIALAVRGFELGRVLLTERAPVGWRLPSHLLTAPGPVRISILHPDGRRPCDIQDNPDNRVLSFSAYSLTLSRVARRPKAEEERKALTDDPASILGRFHNLLLGGDLAGIAAGSEPLVAGTLSGTAAAVRRLIRDYRRKGDGAFRALCTRPSSIGVLKSKPDIPEQLVLPLAAALHQGAAMPLLWAVTADAAHTPGSVERMMPGLFKAFIDDFDKASDGSREIWLDICRAVHAMAPPRAATPTCPAIVTEPARRVVAFVGNCQFATLAAVYRETQPDAAEASVVYVPNYEQATPDARRSVAEAEILVQQVLDFAPRVGDLQSRARVVLVPHVTAAFLWPFTGSAHPLNRREPELDESGPYPPELGDSFLNRQIAESAPPHEALERYAALDLPKIRNIDRLCELVLEKQASRDRACGFNFARFIESRFRSEKLFRTPNHPDLPMARRFVTEALERLGVPESVIAERLAARAQNLFPRSETPIHPAVARHFRLKYVTEDSRYIYFEEGRFTFSEYVLRYMTYQWNPLLARGIHLMRSGDFSGAVESLLAAMPDAPRSAIGRMILAEALVRVGRGGEAFAYAREACLLDPDNIQFQRRAAEMRRAASVPT